MYPDSLRTAAGAAVLGSLLLVVIGCGGGGGSNPSPPQGSKDGKPPPAAGLGKADLTLTAKDFAAEHKTDYKGAGAGNPFVAKYKGKVIELTGTLRGYSFDVVGLSKPALHLAGGPKPTDGYVACFCADPRPWDKATPPQTVKVKGEFLDFGTLPALTRCEVLEASSPGAPTLTADELAKEYAKDMPAAQKKYDNTWLILTGEVDKVAKGKQELGEAARVVFKTEGGPCVECGLYGAYKDAVPSLKPGQKLKVLGEYDHAYSTKDLVSLSSGVLLEGGK